MKKFVSRQRKANDCALQHIKAFREQALAGAVADFGEPCQRCIHRHSCDLDWLSTLLPLLSHADVKIKMGVQAPIPQPDSIPCEILGDMDTHQNMDRSSS